MFFCYAFMILLLVFFYCIFEIYFQQFCTQDLELTFYSHSHWPKGMGAVGMDLLLSFSLAHTCGQREWEAYCNGLLLSFSLVRTHGLREWELLEQTFYSHSHWPTPVAQQNGRLLEWRASTPMDSLGPNTMGSLPNSRPCQRNPTRHNLNTYEQPKPKCADHASNQSCQYHVTLHELLGDITLKKGRIS